MTGDTYVDDTCLCDLPLPKERTGDVQERTGDVQARTVLLEYVCPCGRKWVTFNSDEKEALARLEYGDAWQEVVAGDVAKRTIAPGQWYSPYAGAPYKHTERGRRSYPAKDAEHLTLRDVMEAPYSYMRWFRGHDPDDIGEDHAAALERLEFNMGKELA